LLPDNGKSGCLFLFSPVVSTLRNCFSFFLVFGINLGDILVLTPTLASTNLSLLVVITVILTGENVTGLALEGLDELTLPLIGAYGTIGKFTCLFGLSVNIVIIEVVCILFSKLILAVVLLLLGW